MSRLRYLTLMKIEWLRLWRSGTALTMLAVLMLTSALAAYLGGRSLEREATIVEAMQLADVQRLDTLIEWSQLPVSDTTGRRADALVPSGTSWKGHHTYAAVNAPSELSAWARGVRDFYPSYYALTPKSLFPQLQVSEITNPTHLAAGPFDLALVFVLLLPLLGLALFYDVYAREQEGRTLDLARVQAGSYSASLVPRIALRTSFLVATLLLSLVVSALAAGTGWPTGGASFAGLSLGYALVWSAVVLGLSSLKQSAATTALLGFGLWAITTIAAPSLFNALAAELHPVGGLAEVRHGYRAYASEFWEHDLAWRWNQYAALPTRPEAAAGVLVDTSSAKGRPDFAALLYAYYQLLDVHADSLSAPVYAAAQSRRQYLTARNWMMPGAWVYSRLSAFAKTSHDDHTEFHSRVRHVHGELKTIYYPALMRRGSLSPTDLETLAALRR